MKPRLFPQVEFPFLVAVRTGRISKPDLDRWIDDQEQDKEIRALVYKRRWSTLTDEQKKCSWCKRELPLLYQWACFLVDEESGFVLLCSQCRKRLWNEVGHRVGVWMR